MNFGNTLKFFRWSTDGKAEEEFNRKCRYWQCPNCSRAMTNPVKDKLETQNIFNYCPGCGKEIEGLGEKHDSV